MTRDDFEIMAPVGSRDSLAAALRAGADAVYFGIQGLNMRSRAAVNFTLDDLPLLAAHCRAHNCRAYLTLNTVMFDSDLELCDRILDAAARCGISAVIATDIAAITRARERGLEVHISTQANITNIEAVRHYARWADTMVLARELNLERVAAIHRAIEAGGVCGPSGRPVKIEMFCHGAICMAYSGRCYLSLHEAGTSANRGACAQICRRGYRATDLDTGAELDVEHPYIMSPKDLSTIHFVDRMAGAGVRVFKIEGRARSAEYVATAVRAYDRALRAVCDGSYGSALVRELEQELAKVFNRGFWDGYYLGERLGGWSGRYGSSATRRKRYAARGVRWYSRLGVGEFVMEAGELHTGDEVVVSGPTTGALTFKVEEIRVGLKPVEAARRGDAFSIPVPAKIRASDRLYVWEPVAPPAATPCAPEAEPQA